MFLHLREKTKFIRYDRCNRSILTKRRKKDAPTVDVFRVAAQLVFPFPLFPPNRESFAASSQRFDKFYRLFQFFSKKGTRTVDNAIKRRRVEKKSTEFDLRGADAVRSARSRTFRLRTLFANARRRSRPRVFRRTLAKLSPNFVNFAFSSRVFRFSFKGESNGGA